MTRFGVTSSVEAVDLALFRYCIPAILFFPYLLKNGFFPRGEKPLWIVLIIAGGGLPFGVLVMTGAKLAPASHIAVLMPGAMPLFVILLSRIFLKSTVTPGKVVGLVILLLGIFSIVWEAVLTIGMATIIGDLLLLLAAFIWAIYTIAFQKTNLSAWHGAALISFWSSFFAFGLWLLTHKGGIYQASWNHLFMQLIWQGILAGIVGMWVYGYGMKAIGATKSATIGALLPAVTLIGGWVFLKEVPTELASFGVILALAGVYLVNRDESE
ncbi:MAG: DMT family transporter [Sneathiellales bacterium]|nr:DMT family transporter [Sneathiellales bacterium]